MFEILKALMALQQACQETEDQPPRHMWWGIAPGDNVLRVEIQVTADDREFVERAREMFAADA
jgi:hypothetical protein